MALVLAFDTTAPDLSVALARDGELLAEAGAPQKAASSRLLGLIDEVLERGGVDRTDLSGLLALRGPGSFTGIRIGLATALGIHQAAQIPATATTTLEVLATDRGLPASDAETRVLTLIHALREDWYSQLFVVTVGAAVPLEPPVRRSAPELSALAFDRAIALTGPRSGSPPIPAIEPAPPARSAALESSLRPPSWDPGLLSRPLYLAPPPATLPGPPKAVRPLS